MVSFHGRPPTHLTVGPLDAAGVRHAFTTRHHGTFPAISAPGGPFGGDSRPALAALGVDGALVRFARQVHGTACLVADDAPPGLVGVADALVTRTPGTPIAVFTADCLPIVLTDPWRRVLAVAHAGWRGTVAGLARRLVELLVERFRVAPLGLHAAIGPSIGPCCYEVDEPVVGPLRTAFPDDWERWTRARGPGTWMLDLWQANADQLADAGVPPDQVANPRLCTGCRRDLFFSYRKEGAGGRLATVALLG